MKTTMLAAALLCSASPLMAAEPDGLILPPGFHATVVADGVGQARHLAVRGNGDVYVSTRHGKDQPVLGVIALRLGADHRAVQTEHFSNIDNGTGIRVEGGQLYAATPTAIYRFQFAGNELVPTAAPQPVVDGLPANGFGNRPIALDGQGNLFVGIGGSGNICNDPATPKDAKPVGLTPCPALTGRSGIWRFNANTRNQHFPADGELLATGIRDVDALDFSRTLKAPYTVLHGRNGTHDTWPDLVSAEDESAIAEEMHRVGKGADFGWPYSYYDAKRNIRLTAPEYGGDGKTAPAAKYDTPVVAFPAHNAPLDMVFYSGTKFPAKYRGGAFVVFHGGSGPALAEGRPGYNVMFVPFDKKGMAGKPDVFADGFAGATPGEHNADTAKYRPVGAAVGPDGALYVADSQKGRIWRIAYGN